MCLQQTPAHEFVRSAIMPTSEEAQQDTAVGTILHCAPAALTMLCCLFCANVCTHLDQSRRRGIGRCAWRII